MSDLNCDLKICTPATVLFEGAHKVGKSTTVAALSKRTGYFDVLIDRGVASNYAFGKLYKRPKFDLEFAWEQYFANKFAVLVHCELGATDYEDEIASGLSLREQWVGFVPTYSNTLLDKYVAEAVKVAKQICPERVLSTRARLKTVNESCDELLDWLAKFRKLPV